MALAIINAINFIPRKKMLVNLSSVYFDLDEEFKRIPWIYQNCVSDTTSRNIRKTLCFWHSYNNLEYKFGYFLPYRLQSTCNMFFLYLKFEISLIKMQEAMSLLNMLSRYDQNPDQE